MFTSDATASITGPDWLQAIRRSALARAAEMSLPSASEEIWRYTPIGDLDLARFAPVVEPGPVRPSRLAGAETISDAAAVVDFQDGHLIEISIRDSAQSQVTIERVSDAEDGESILGATMSAEPDVFDELNLGLAGDAVVVRIARGAVVEGPVVIRHNTDISGALVCSRVIVVAGENSEASVVEVHASGDAAALTIPITELMVEPAARLRYMSLQVLGSATWQLGTQMATIDRDGHLLASAVALGGDYSRVRTDTRMIGRGAGGDIIAVYFGDGDQILDFRTYQQHVAPDTNSNLLFKGALDDRAKSIYTGLIRIEPDASGVTAHQTNRNIKLSDEAWAESVPNLEIENNDVKCSHASAVGPIDEDQRFYLESRGVPTEVAERLVVQGFFNEVLSQLPHAGLASQVESELIERLQVGVKS